MKSQWILLTHQLPSHPSNIRVQVWRKLQALGALPVKNSIYILPNDAETREDFEWLRKEILQIRGEASIFLADSISNVENGEIVAAFRKARAKDYDRAIRGLSALKEKIKGLLMSGHIKPEAIVRLDKEWTPLKNDLSRLQKIDFFKAPNRVKAQTLAVEMLKLFDQVKKVSLKGSLAELPLIYPKDFMNRTWVTRTSPHVDRLASAWLIRRYIDPQARFKFVREPYRPKNKNEVRFDMYEAEFTHYGDWCTFENVMHRLNLKDPGLLQLAEIIHDIDLKDNKFGWDETPGLKMVVSGLCEAHRDDFKRLEAGLGLFDALYAALKKPK